MRQTTKRDRHRLAPSIILLDIGCHSNQLGTFPAFLLLCMLPPDGFEWNLNRGFSTYVLWAVHSRQNLRSDSRFMWDISQSPASSRRRSWPLASKEPFRYIHILYRPFCVSYGHYGLLKIFSSAGQNRGYMQQKERPPQ